jgi:arginase family enzyme
MDCSIYLSPSVVWQQSFEEGTLGHIIQPGLNEDATNHLAEFKLAIVGVSESRNAAGNLGSKNAPEAIRSLLFQLTNNWNALPIIDLGNITSGSSLEDTYHALSATVRECIQNNVVPIIIGGSNDLILAIYRAYEALEQVVNIVSIDNQFDLGDVESPIDSKSYLNKIILHQPNFLFNYSCLGYQTYFVSLDQRELMDRLYFDTYRLGEVQADIREVEPVVRNADIVSFDISAIRQSDAPGNEHATPNGFYGEEACAISRYAGLSEKLTAFGLFEVNPEVDWNNQTAHLSAQMIWYFIEGFASRKHDGFNRESKDLLKYTVTTDGEIEEIIFYKNLRSDRWWMDVPYPESGLSKFRRHQLVPCSYKDYKLACNNEIPDKWWRSFQKMH